MSKPRRPAAKRASAIGTRSRSSKPAGAALDLETFEGRLAYRVRLATELQTKKASYKRSVQIGHEIRLIQQQAKDSAEHDELVALRGMEEELRAIRAEQARMRAGVVRANQAPELPHEGSPEPH